MGATNLWLMRMTPKTGDCHPAEGDDVHAADHFLFFCVTISRRHLALYYTTQNLFTILQLYHQNRKLPHAGAWKKLRSRETPKIGRSLTPKELLDTILGYLGFRPVQIDETQG